MLLSSTASTRSSIIQLPQGERLWLAAKFEQAGPGSVTLTLTSLLKGSSEYFSEVDFNFRPAQLVLGFIPLGWASLSQLSITQTTGPTAQVAKSIDGESVPTGLLGLGSAGSGFDISLNFGANAFDGSDVAKFTLSFSGLKESDFSVSNYDGSGLYYLAAAIKGIQPGTGLFGLDHNGAIAATGETVGITSLSVVPAVAVVDPVPEPASCLVWGALGFLIFRTRKSRGRLYRGRILG